MRNFCAILTCCLANLTLSAQVHDLSLGVSAGINSSGSTVAIFNHRYETIPQQGGGAHVFVDCGFGRWFAINARVGSVVEHQRTEDNTQPYYRAYFDWTYKWAEGSVVGRFRMFYTNSFELFTGAGLTAKRCRTATGQGNWAVGNEWEQEQMVITEDVYKWNYGLPLQVGAAVKIWRSHRIFLLAEYTPSLRSKHPDTYAVYPQLTRTYFASRDGQYMYAFNAGYMFSLSRK
jgi:hypothetical protein